MTRTHIVAIALIVFLVVASIFWKVTVGPYKKEYNEKARKLGARVYYWQALILISGGITFAIMALLVWANVLTY